MSGKQSVCVTEAMVETFCRDGVVVIREALDEPAMACVEAAYNHMLATSDRLEDLSQYDSAQNISAADYSIDDPSFEALMRETPIAQIVNDLFGGGGVWYTGDQILLKTGDKWQRTQWHQDSAYEAYDSPKCAVVWITFTDVAQENALEIALGTHRGPTYNVIFSEQRSDDEVGAYDPVEWGAPVIPEMDKVRDDYDMFSTATRRGDMIVFHHNAIHGGGVVHGGMERRTLTIRLAGDDARFVQRPRMIDAKRAEVTENSQGPRIKKAFSDLQHGQLLSTAPHIRRVF